MLETLATKGKPLSMKTVGLVVLTTGIPAGVAGILSQATSGDGIPPGTAGWASFGLAGAILGWLFVVHLPAKDKLILSLIEARDKSIDKIVTAHERTVNRIVDESKADRVAHERDTDRIIASIDGLARRVGHERPA